jgi:hypothetical protein
MVDVMAMEVRMKAKEHEVVEARAVAAQLRAEQA